MRARLEWRSFPANSTPTPAPGKPVSLRPACPQLQSNCTSSPTKNVDEATAAIDYESENLFQSHLKQIAVGRTIIMIAHRLSTVQNADAILVMDEGRVVEAGGHEQLLKKNGAYAALVKASGLGG